MMFRVGQKVARIKLPDPTPGDLFLLAKYCPRYPGEGEVCTVANAFDDRIELLEYPQPGSAVFPARGFLASAFRPIVEYKTDISIFKKMLTPKREHLPA